MQCRLSVYSGRFVVWRTTTTIQLNLNKGSVKLKKSLFLQITRKKKHLIQISYGPISSTEYEDCLEMMVEHSDTLIMDGHKVRLFCLVKRDKSVTVCRKRSNLYKS